MLPDGREWLVAEFGADTAEEVAEKARNAPNAVVIAPQQARGFLGPWLLQFTEISQRLSWSRPKSRRIPIRNASSGVRVPARFFGTFQWPWRGPAKPVSAFGFASPKVCIDVLPKHSLP